jgi:cell division septation protein DedD
MTTPNPAGQRGNPSTGFTPPTQPGGGPPPPAAKPARGGRSLGVGLGVVAVLLALGAVVLSWRANGRANDALDRVAALPSGPPPVAPPPAAGPGTDAPTPDETALPTTAGPTDVAPQLNAQTEYKTKYTSQTLRVPAGCNDTVYVDLDEPRVGADGAKAEFSYSKPCGAAGSPSITLSQGVRGSEVDSDTVTPTECADRIRTSPLLDDDSQPIRRGQVFCVNSSISEAVNSAQTWKMALVSVSAIAQEGTVTFKVSAWDIPT